MKTCLSICPRFFFLLSSHCCFLLHLFFPHGPIIHLFTSIRGVCIGFSRLDGIPWFSGHARNHKFFLVCSIFQQLLIDIYYINFIYLEKAYRLYDGYYNGKFNAHYHQVQSQNHGLRFITFASCYGLILNLSILSILDLHDSMKYFGGSLLLS